MGEDSVISTGQEIIEDQAYEHDQGSSAPAHPTVPAFAIEVIDIDGICGVY
jgi:hypothetical protein